MTAKYRLAASAEMLFQELEFNERVKHIASRGFEVEIWNWTTKNLDELAATGATFSSMTGYIEGDLLDDDGIENLLNTARQSLEASMVIDCPRLNVHGTGLDSNGQAIKQKSSTSPAEFVTAVKTLTRLAKLGEEYGKVFTLENLNLLVDHPGTPFALASETLALIEAVDHPNLRLNLDLYHAQIGEGNLTELVAECFDYIGEIQVADVPGRMQPGTGEINYKRIAAELKTLGYSGVVGLEGWALGDSDQALDDFANAFA
ncbi:MAG: TIM barrel protein [Rhodoluna sp.]|nr:TIM barrel protein [Rhodoluna sp.]